MSYKRSANPASKLVRFFLVAILGLTTTLLPIQSPVARAATPQYGYLWNLVFDFNTNFNGVLTVEVGPWENGELISIEETSTTEVRCKRIGNVTLQDGFASFPGDAYLECKLNIGKVVRSKHKLKPNNPDTYGSMVMRTRAALVGDSSAPIFYHPDAQFRLDPNSPVDIDLITDISNNNGPMSSTISDVNWNTWQSYTSYYRCSTPVNCNLEHSAGPTTIELANQGTAITFATGPTTFTIGKDDTGNLTGRIDTLIVDPGNFVH